MEKIFWLFIVIFSLATGACATNQRVIFEDRTNTTNKSALQSEHVKVILNNSKPDFSYRSNHWGIFPGPDNAISSSVAAGIYLNKKAEANRKDAETEILRKYANNPEKYDEIAKRAGLVSTQGELSSGFAILILNHSPFTLNVGLTGNPFQKIIHSGGHEEFSISNTRFYVYADKITSSGERYYKQGRVSFSESAEIPFEGKLYAHRVIIK